MNNQGLNPEYRIEIVVDQSNQLLLTFHLPSRSYDVNPTVRHTSKTKIPSVYSQVFNSLTPLGDHISNPQPDYFNGSHPAEIHSKVRDDLENYVIIPSSQRHRPALPKFFAEAKGPDGKASEAKRQTTQDLVAGARRILMMQSYQLYEPVFDNNAHASGSTYYSGYLQLYAMHPTEPGDVEGEPKYYTTRINGYDLNGNPDSHRQGMAAFRNLRDLAKGRRDEFIAGANERVDNDD